MDLQFAQRNERLSTLETVVLLSVDIMNPHVVPQKALCAELFPTGLTRIWFFTSVRAHVSRQVVLLPEILSTHRTLVRTKAAMCPYMTLEGTRLSKRLSTQLARVWPLASVRAHVACQTVCLPETPATLGAPVRGSMREVRPLVSP
jgi:hypothetical protein